MTFYKYRLVNGTSMQTHCMYAQYAYCYDVYIFIIEQSSGMRYQLTLYCFITCSFHLQSNESHAITCLQPQWNQLLGSLRIYIAILCLQFDSYPRLLLYLNIAQNSQKV